MANTFNFARSPFTNERLPRLIMTTALVAVVSVSVVHGALLTRYLLREQEALDSQVEDLRKELSETEARIATAQQIVAQNRTELGTEQTQFLTRLFRRKSFSWTGLLNELEAITPPSVRITAIAPSEEEGRISVTMTVVGQTLQDVLSMVRALESSSFFATVFPVEEANLAERREGETGIAATLQLEYVEDVRVKSEPPPEKVEEVESESGPSEIAPGEGVAEETQEEEHLP